MWLAIIFLYSIRSSRPDFLAPEELNILLHCQLVNNQYVFVSWDEVPQGNYNEVKVTVIVESDLKEHFTIIVPFIDKSLLIKDFLTSLNRYFVTVSLLIDSLISVTSLPFYLLMSTENVLYNGMYDVLAKLQPSDQQLAYNSSFWDDISELNTEILKWQLFNGTAVSPLALSKEYGNIFMLAGNATMLIESHNTLLSAILNISNNKIEKDYPDHEEPKINIALNKYTNSSPIYNVKTRASNAVDGNKNNLFHSQFLTDPWLMIDLGKSSYIHKIIVYNRLADNFEEQNRLTNFKIFVGEESSYNSNTVCVHHEESTGNMVEIELKCGISVNGRFVHLVSYGVKYLNIRELEVYGYEGLRNLALFGTVEVSSSLTSVYSPEKAIDGLFDINLNFMHTKLEENPYLRIRHASRSVILMVVVYNRKDCCRNRLDNFQINVGSEINGIVNPLCGKYGVVGNLYKIKMICSSALVGRYTQLTLVSELQILNIDELETFGYQYHSNNDCLHTNTFTTEHHNFGRIILSADGFQGFGIGFISEPYIGFYRRHFSEYQLSTDPTPVAFLGLRDTASNISVNLQTLCQSTFRCGLGRTKSFVYHENRMVVVYSQAEAVCLYQECPFVAPTNVRQLDVSSTSITITWNQIDLQFLVEPLGFQYYIVNVTNIKTLLLKSFTEATLQLNVSELAVSTEYIFTVAGVASGIIGNWSRNRTFKTLEEIPVGRARNFRAVAVNSTSVVLKWDNVKNDLVLGTFMGYQLKILSVHKKIVVNVSTVEDYIVENLMPNSIYTFELRVRNHMYLAETTAVVDLITSVAVPTALVKDFKVSTVNDTSVYLKWRFSDLKNIHGQFEGYQLNYTAEFSVIKNISAANEYWLTELTPYTWYMIELRVRNNMFVAENATVLNVRTSVGTPMSVGKNLTVTRISSFIINISWLHAESKLIYGPMKGYKLVYFSETNATVSTISMFNVLTWTLTDLQPFTNYTIQVYTENEQFTSEKCTTITARTLPTTAGLPPRNVRMSKTSSTSFNISWEDILDKGWGNEHKRHGFKLTIYNESVQFEYFVKYDTEYWVEVKGLVVFSKYNLQIAGVNAMGVGVAVFKSAYTQEEAPIAAPSVATLIAINPNTVYIQWKKFKTDRGVIRSFRIIIRPFMSRRRRDTSYNSLNKNLVSVKDPFSTSSQDIVVNATSLNYTITGLLGGMVYRVQIAAQTLFLGVFTDWLDIQTPVGIPLLPVYNITCTLVDSRSLLISWLESSRIYNQGGLIKYRVYSTDIESNVTLYIDVKANSLNGQLFFLNPLREHAIHVSSLTSAGEGPKSPQNLMCRPQGVPGSAPLNVSVQITNASQSVFVAWNSISDWNHLGAKSYHLYLTHRTNGEHLVPNPPTMFHAGNVTSFTLRDLESYSTYEVSVSACSPHGCGKKSKKVTFATCRLSSDEVIFNYTPLFPFVYNNSLGQLDGILIVITQQAISHCAMISEVYSGQGINFLIKELRAPAGDKEKSRMQIPVVDRNGHDGDVELLEIFETPRFVLVSIPKDVAGEGETMVTNSATDIFPLCGLFVLINAVFGVFYWLLVFTLKLDSSHCFTLRGLANGVYLTYMTSTTVGYGDVHPTTHRGRVYIVLWSLIGLVLTSIFVGKTSSTLTTSYIKVAEDETFQAPEKIIAVHGSPAYVFADRQLARFERTKTFLSAGEVLKQLHERKYKYAIFDMLTARLYESLIASYNLEELKTISASSSIKLALYGELKKLKPCISSFVSANSDLVVKEIRKLLKVFKVNRTLFANKTEEVSHVHATTSPVLISWKSKLFRNILMVSTGAWLFLLLLGSVYEFVRLRMCISEPFIEKATLQSIKYERTVEVAEQLKNEIQEIVFQFEERTSHILHRHGEQMFGKLTKRLSKLYGVNVAHIKLSDLAVTPGEMEEVRKELPSSSSRPHSAAIYT